MQCIIEDDITVTKANVIVSFARPHGAGVMPDATFLNTPEDSLIVKSYERPLIVEGHRVKVGGILGRVEAPPVLIARSFDGWDAQTCGKYGRVFGGAPKTIHPT